MSTGIGDYIRDQRVALGYKTQTAFAEYAGINSAHLNQIERGKIALPNAELRRKLAKALGVSHIEILVQCGEIDPDEVGGAGGDTQTQAERVLLPIIRAHEWTEPQLRAAAGSLKAIAEMGKE